MLSPNEKIGGCPLKQLQLLRFPLFLTNSHAIDIPCLQQALSWRGNHSNAIIYERLDRSICHTNFYDCFDNITIFYGNFTVSDHVPIMFSTNEEEITKPPPFRFQNFWTLDIDSH